MHRVTGLSYVGQPNETATLTTKVGEGGQISVTLDGQSISSNTQFQLPNAAGGQMTLQIALIGPIGATCVVGLATVDGGTDGDLLLAQTHSPAPVHFYTFSVANQTAVTAFGALKTSKRIGPKQGKKGGRR